MKFRSSLYVLASILMITGCGKKNDTGTSAAPATTTTSAAPVVDENAATLTGTVKFTGAKPTPKKISMSADAYCKTQHGDGVTAEDVVVNPNGTLKWVYVYVKSGLPADRKFPPSTEPVIFDQKGCMYSPHVAAVQVGQPFKVRNSDTVLHNVHAQPKINTGFNFGQPAQGMENSKTFDKPEVMIPVKCDVHPWMAGWIGVQDHPFAAVTGDDGSFTIKNLPPGNYVIEAWHEKYGTTTQNVTVGAKESKSVEFAFKG